MCYTSEQAFPEAGLPISARVSRYSSLRLADTQVVGIAPLPGLLVGDPAGRAPLLPGQGTVPTHNLLQPYIL